MVMLTDCAIKTPAELYDTFVFEDTHRGLSAGHLVVLALSPPAYR